MSNAPLQTPIVSEKKTSKFILVAIIVLPALCIVSFLCIILAAITIIAINPAEKMRLEEDKVILQPEEEETFEEDMIYLTPTTSDVLVPTIDSYYGWSNYVNTDLGISLQYPNNTFEVNKTETGFSLSLLYPSGLFGKSSVNIYFSSEEYDSSNREKSFGNPLFMVGKTIYYSSQWVSKEEVSNELGNLTVYTNTQDVIEINPNLNIIINRDSMQYMADNPMYDYFEEPTMEQLEQVNLILESVKFN